MIEIRREQLAELTHMGIESFVRTLASELRGKGEPVARHSDGELLRASTEGVAAALQLGLLAAAQIERFVLCRLRHGEGFPHAFAWARALMDDASLTPVQLLERFEAHP